MRAQFAALLRTEKPNEQLAASMSGMDICYVPDAPHPLIGRRVPDGEIMTAAGRLRVYKLLREQRTVLLDFEGIAERACAVPDTVAHVAAQKTVRRWRLPVVGWVEVPSALLIRPDGHVAWVSSDSSWSDLSEARLAG